MSYSIEKVELAQCHEADDLVVVIDVIRAFTTAAYAVARGCEKLIAVSGIDEARKLHDQTANSLLAGEDKAIPIPGFHCSNSPFEMMSAPVQGKTLVFRTSSGTQGVVRAKKAKKMIVSSFVIAEATCTYIHRLKPKKVTFVITGSGDHGQEDYALADYLEAKLVHGKVDPKPYLERVRNSPSGINLAKATRPHFRPEDLEAVCAIDAFDFALEVNYEEGFPVIRAMPLQDNMNELLS